MAVIASATGDASDVRRATRSRRSRSAMVMVTCAVLLAACTGGSAAPSQRPPQLNGHLIWWDLAAQVGSKPAAKNLLERFHAAFPGITVDLVEIGVDEIKAKFDTAAQAASGAPDVITLDSSWVADFAARGYLAKLDGTLADTGLADVVPSMVPTLKWDGRLVALPRSADADALLYNPALLRTAGVSVPRTWAEVSAARLKLSAKGIQTLYAPATGPGLLPWIFGSGGQLIDVSGKKILVNRAEALRGLTARIGLQATDVAVSDSTTDSVAAMHAAFREGQVAMIIDRAAALSGLAGGAAFTTPADIGIAVIPADIGQPRSLLTGTVYSVYAASSALPSAYELTKFLSSSSSQDQFTRSLGLIPTRTSAYRLPNVQASDMARGFQPVIAAATPLPQIPQNGNLLAPLDDPFRRALAGDTSAQQALDEVAAAYRKTFPDFTSNLP